ncbi:hypothetical protein [Streptomyces yunnanensis]|uniref:Integral membrane protein n=1 Tax=Streptomyces yunnanensis TaxID=156453 RepID=A0A9X8MP66_9ACTN|nr:hypothetical protein [Streptomyces yunnanensis]SHL23589.1 hypothetical protein SAMN05216268_103311 [Streptomyces yunnanensis]
MTAPESGTAAPPARPAPRHGPADPVKILMYRHRTLCERAVDPLEIAAGLEAHGVTDRAAARFRHRDVFSLAEELYARVPRADGPERGASAGPEDEPEALNPAPAPDPAAPAPAPRSRFARGAVQLLPGAIGLATVAAHASVVAPTPPVRGAVDAAGLLLTVLAVRLALRRGPLRLRRGPGSRTAVLGAVWAVGYAVYGDWLLAQLLSGGPDVPGPHPRAAVAAAVALACVIAPAAGCAHWFARRARRGVVASRALAELAARVRPLLIGATLLFVVAAGALTVGAQLLLARAGSSGGRWAVPAVVALAVLLFLARLLAVHGFPAAAAAGLGGAAALEAVALALVLTARLPGLARLGTPVEALVTAAGPAAVPAVACAVAALGLLVRGLRALTGACAHPPADMPERPGGTPVGDPAEAHRP